MRIIIILLSLAAFCLAQSTQPALDGAILTIQRQGQTERYKLVQQPPEITNPPQQNPTQPVPNPQPSTSTPTFELFASTNAPAGVWVNALPTALDPLNTTFAWDFGDPDSHRNQLPGFTAAHVYDRPGDYNIKLTLTTPGKPPIILNKKIRVDPDTRKNIHIANNGDDANDGSAQKPLKSLEKAAEIARDNTRILLARGDVFDTRQQFIAPGKGLIITAYGDPSKPKPVIRYTGDQTTQAIIRCSPQTESLIVEQITFDSIVGNAPDARTLPHCIVAAGKQIIIRDCTFLNVSYAINGNGKPQGVIIQKCDSPNVDGLRRYLAWIEGSDWCILDNIALNSTREHIIRGVHYQRLLIAFNNLANINRKEVDGIDIAKNTINLQAGQEAYVHGNKLSGPSSIGPLGKTDGLQYKSHRARCYIVENNRFENAPLEVQHGIADVVIRDNSFTIDNARCIVLDGYNKEYDRGLSNIRIQNNTGINNAKSGGFLLVNGKVDGISLTQNRYDAPNLQSGAQQAANVYVNDTDLASFTSITSNTWSKGKPLAFAEGGMMYVFPKWSDKQGYLDPAEWSRLPQVKNDVFK